MRVLSRPTGVCEKNTPPGRKTLWKIGFQSTKSDAGMQFLPPACLAKARAKAVFFHRHRYHVLSPVKGRRGAPNDPRPRATSRQTAATSLLCNSLTSLSWRSSDKSLTIPLVRQFSDFSFLTNPHPAISVHSDVYGCCSWSFLAACRKEELVASSPLAARKPKASLPSRLAPLPFGDRNFIQPPCRKPYL